MTVIYPVSSSCSTAADNLGRPFIPWRVIFSMSETRRIPGVIRGHKVSFSPCLARCPTRPPLLLSFYLFRRPRWNLPRLLRRRLRSPMVRQVWSLISRRALRGKRSARSEQRLLPAAGCGYKHGHFYRAIIVEGEPRR